jgi:ATP-dependent RNA helicase RhlE
LRHILADASVTRVLVFTRTKHGADRLQRSLEKFGIPAEAIHGNKSQGARVRSLTNFKDGSSRVLVATDLAARGLDVDDISHVVNYDLPNEPETYVHRIGRTGRAGRAGISFSFCAPDDTGFLRDIERLIRMRIQVAPTPAEAELRSPEPMAISAARLGNDGGRGDGSRSDGSRNSRGPGRGRGNGSSGFSEGREERRDSGHRRASTGHNPAGRGREGRPENAPAGNGNAKDTRPSHLRSSDRDSHSHGNAPAKRKNRGGERSFVREYYSNER